MPRKYQRKTVTKYKLEDLERAVQDVKNKTMSIGNAASVYSIPKSTIHDCLKKEVINEPKTGRKAIFTNKQEMELEEHILKCSKLFHGLTVEMVRKIAFKFAEVNNLKHTFDKTAQMAGKDWFYGFKKRHPNILLRKPESTSNNGIAAFTEWEVKMFFNNLKALQTKYHFDADHIYNVDRTSICNVERISKILAPEGQKQVSMATSVERGTTTTVVCALSASGKYVPPFFIFKMEEMNAYLLRGGNVDMVAAVSDSGSINENLFIDWLHHFISFARPTVEEPILLILDNHESLVSVACYQLCSQNGIILLFLPPHTSHRLQPLDLTYFGPLKTAYHRECDLYMASNVGQQITQYEVVELFTKAFNRISDVEKAANGFRAAGIWPLDTTKFDDQFVAASSLLEYPIGNLERAATPDLQIKQAQESNVSFEDCEEDSVNSDRFSSVPVENEQTDPLGENAASRKVRSSPTKPSSFPVYMKPPPERTSYKKFKRSLLLAEVGNVIRRLDANAGTEIDSIEHFGRYVASQIRSLPRREGVLLQQEIQTSITQALIKSFPQDGTSNITSMSVDVNTPSTST